jgi:hypothetical protein
MNYAYWANVVASLHFTVILAVVVGLIISFRYKRFRPWEAALLISIFILWSYYGNCPLAILEQYLRDKAGQHVNITSLGFTTYYARKFLGMAVPSKIIQQSTFFSGAMFFGASIEWLEPYFHFHLFGLRKMLKKKFGIKSKRRYA